MTTLQKQIKHINNNLFAARMENIIQYMYEDELEKQVAKVFHRMRKGILKNLKEYYSPDIMVNAHMDLILAPIHEYHKKYYDTIMKYKLREHRKGQVQGRRLVKRAKQYAKTYSKNYFGAVKADSTIPMSSIIQKDKLFATSDYSAEHMRDKTFLASENTLARVDKDINKIITDGYTDGWGINDVASNIEKRFNQLETWEARRIARTEIHGSHMQGIMQSYEEMGVEYTQWASAHDNRTRDTHSALDGEIIPLGGVYSNGLRYPGDTSGPISEWINCRCGNIPWFCPPGMMVPVGMSHFRESDLIPLGYYDKPGVIESLQEPVFNEEKNAMLYGVPIKDSLIKNQFAVPTEDLSEFGISKNGLKTIQKIQKRNFGEAKEYGFRFDKKTGKLLSDEFEGTGKNVNIPSSKKNYSSIHNHTGDGLNPPSADDFYAYFINKNEDVAINVSRNETWLIKSENFNSKKIDKICQKVYDIEVKQIQKLNKEYDSLKHLVRKGKMTQNELDNYLANEFIYKHNKELGDNLLKELANVKGLKVKRIFNNTKIKPETIDDLKDIKTVKPKGNSYVRKSPQIKDYDKYALTEAEEKTLAKLEPKKDSLKFKDKHLYEELANRKEFSKMWNKILIEGGDPHDYFAISGAEGVKYERLYKQFKNWIPKSEIEIKPIKIKKDVFNNKNAFKLSTEEKEIYKQLKENIFNLSDDELKYYSELKDKVTLNKYHNKLLNEVLDEFNSKEYIQLYSKNKEKWQLPDLSVDLKFTTPKLGFEKDVVEVPIGKKYALSEKEVSELDILRKKRLLSDNGIEPRITKQELSRIESLEKQKEFNYWYYVRKGEGGLKYEYEQKYQKLFGELKDKLSLSEDLLKPVKLPEYKPQEISTNNRRIKLKGKTEDGHIPGKHTVDELFTVDVTKCTLREQQVIERWLGNEYAYFRDYLTRAGRDIDDYVEFVLHADSEHLERYGYIKNMIEKGELKEAAKQIREIGLSVEHDLPILENILENNSTKKAMTLWRTEERLHIDGDLEVGKVVTFKGYNSTAVTKEGAKHFAETSSRDFKWMYEIEAPSGTKGAYVAELNKNPKFAQEMEFLLDKDTEMEIVDFDEVNHYVKFRIINIGAAIKSNMWNSIKNKIWSGF